MFSAVDAARSSKLPDDPVLPEYELCAMAILVGRSSLPVAAQLPDRAVCSPVSAARRSELIGHPRPARAHRLGAALGAIPGRLMLGLGVDLGPYQYDDGRQPQPDEKADHRAEGAIGRVEGAEARDIPRQQERSADPDAGRERTAPRYPAPPGLRAARTKAVETCQAERDDDK